MFSNSISVFFKRVSGDVRGQMFALLSFVSFLGMEIMAVLDFFFTDKRGAAVFAAGGLLFLFGLIYVNFAAKNIQRVSDITMSLLIFVFLPLIFFIKGGICGTTMAWYCFAALCVGFLSAEKSRLFFLAGEVFSAALCWRMGNTSPQLLFRASERAEYIDSFLSMVVTGCITIILIGYQTTLYKKENLKAEERKSEIENLNEVQSRFFSSMSHELRSPINTIIGINEMILRQNASPEINEDAEYIRSAGNMLLHLVNDILDVSKLKTGQMHLVLEPYTLSGLLSEVAAMMLVGAKEKGLVFQVDVAKDVPSRLLGDEIRIKQILINVLNNAIKYTEEGFVWLFVEAVKKSERDVVILFSVRDTGIGIRKEDIPHLFSAFSRVEETRNRFIEGTGLGLSIVRQLVDLMGGSVTVNSVYTRGSTFNIEIPQEVMDWEGNVGLKLEKTKSEGRDSEYMPSFEAPEARVLVVDDTEPNLVVARKLLSSTKIQLDTAESGQQALKRTQTKSYDVIFMDHMMPEMNGIECLHRLRDQTGGRSKNARVVAFTANADDENRILYQREGFDGYLVKPVTGEAFESELLRLLPEEKVRLLGERDGAGEKAYALMQEYRMKASVAITTESVAAMPEDTAEKYQIAVIPYILSTEEGNFRDGIDIQADDALCYDKTKKRITSKCPEVNDYEHFFADALSRANHIIHISQSSGIAGSGYANAVEAARSFDSVYVVDSGQLVSGVAFLVQAAARMVEGGLGASDILKRLDAIKKTISANMILGEKGFSEGSLFSKAFLARVCGAFMLTPMLGLDHGRVVIRRFYVGSRKSVWKKYIAHELRFLSNIDVNKLYIAYAGISREDLEWIKGEVEKRAAFKRIHFKKASPAMAIAGGPGSFGLMLRMME